MRIFFLSVSLSFILADMGLSQTVTFDIAKFLAPAGWTRNDNGTYLSYTITNNANGTYCVLGIYKSINSSGDLEKDFKSDWNGLVAQKLGINQEPQKQRGDKKDGYDVLTGAGTFTQGKSAGLAILTTLSNNSRMMSVVMLTNDTAYFSDFRSFYNSFRLEDPSASLTASDQPLKQMNSTSGFGNYIFTAPPDWKAENSADAVILRGPDNSSVITILPLVQSSGNLENDMESIFWQVFPGWEADAQNPDHHIYTKGVSPSGWDYYKKEIGICKSDDKRIEIYGFIMLARVNNQDAVIAGSYARGGDLLDEVYKSDWIIFFHSLDFKNFTKTPSLDLSKEILGSWSGGGSSALSTYTFASNGHYSTGSAYSTSHRITDYTVSETTTSFGGEGEYKVNGNVLTMTSADGKRLRTPKIRIFYRKDFGDWHKYLGMMDTSVVDGTIYEVDLRRDER
jgi:hypothetical protein